MTERLTVVIPTCARTRQQSFLLRSVSSVRAQLRIHARFELDIRVCFARGSDPPKLPSVGLSLIESRGTTVAIACNTALEQVDSDYIAILEDDDWWAPTKTAIALDTVRRGFDFVSSTQLEITEETREIVRINDFATPSGWLMPLSTWRDVGPFDETFQLHQDNEWLGRCRERGKTRTHLVEDTAPTTVNAALQCRQSLYAVMTIGNSALTRHTEARPLVNRSVHAESMSMQNASDASRVARSREEYDRCQQRFGRIPW
jgi:Glycosyl transferase family 2